VLRADQDATYTRLYKYCLPYKHCQYCRHVREVRDVFRTVSIYALYVTLI